MKIIEVSIELSENGNDRVCAYCTVTFENLIAVHDIKIIKTEKGLLVAMPSRKLQDKCSICNTENHLKAKFCNECGCKFAGPGIGIITENGREKIYEDIVHPICAEGRKMITDAVLDAYYKEVKLAVDRVRDSKVDATYTQKIIA